MVESSNRRTHRKASQHTAEQIIKILEQAEKGDQTIGAVCRTNGIAEFDQHSRWCAGPASNQYHGVCRACAARVGCADGTTDFTRLGEFCGRWLHPQPTDRRTVARL